MMIEGCRRSILLAFALLASGCTGDFPWFSANAPVAKPVPKADDLVVAPQALLLNVPSGDPCPCPFESTGSFQVSGSSGMPLTWTSADRSVAEVSAQGIVSAIAPGTTTLTLSAGDLTATASVQVLDKGGRAAVEIR